MSLNLAQWINVSWGSHSGKENEEKSHHTWGKSSSPLSFLCLPVMLISEISENIESSLKS